MHELINWTLGKLQIAPLKFRCIWILHLEVLEFGFYLLKFGGVWILPPNISEFGPSKILGVFGFYLLKFGVFGFYTLKEFGSVKSK